MAASWCAEDLARVRADRAKDWGLASYVCKCGGGGVVVFGFWFFKMGLLYVPLAVLEFAL